MQAAIFVSCFVEGEADSLQRLDAKNLIAVQTSRRVHWSRSVTANGNHTIVRSAIAQRLTDQMKRIVLLALALPMILGGYPAKAQLPVKKVLTLEVVKKIAAAAEAEAKKRGATVVIVVVDDGGHLLLLERLDDTQVASVEVGIGKARTAAIFRRSKQDVRRSGP